MVSMTPDWGQCVVREGGYMVLCMREVRESEVCVAVRVQPVDGPSGV